MLLVSFSCAMIYSFYFDLLFYLFFAGIISSETISTNGRLLSFDDKDINFRRIASRFFCRHFSHLLSRILESSKVRQNGTLAEGGVLCIDHALGSNRSVRAAEETGFRPFLRAFSVRRFSVTSGTRRSINEQDREKRNELELATCALRKLPTRCWHVIWNGRFANGARPCCTTIFFACHGNGISSGEMIRFAAS